MAASSCRALTAWNIWNKTTSPRAQRLCITLTTDDIGELTLPVSYLDYITPSQLTRRLVKESIPTFAALNHKYSMVWSQGDLCLARAQSHQLSPLWLENLWIAGLSCKWSTYITCLDKRVGASQKKKQTARWQSKQNKNRNLHQNSSHGNMQQYAAAAAAAAAARTTARIIFNLLDLSTPFDHNQCLATSLFITRISWPSMPRRTSFTWRWEAWTSLPSGVRNKVSGR